MAPSPNVISFTPVKSEATDTITITYGVIERDENNNGTGQIDNGDGLKGVSTTTAYAITFTLISFVLLVAAFLIVGIKRFRQKIIYDRTRRFSNQSNGSTRERLVSTTRNTAVTPPLPRPSSSLPRDRFSNLDLGSEATLVAVTPLPPVHHRVEVRFPPQRALRGSN